MILITPQAGENWINYAGHVRKIIGMENGQFLYKSANSLDSKSRQDLSFIDLVLDYGWRKLS